MDKEVVGSKLCCCGLSVFLAHSSAQPHTVAGGNAQGRKKHVRYGTAKRCRHSHLGKNPASMVQILVSEFFFFLYL